MDTEPIDETTPRGQMDDINVPLVSVAVAFFAVLLVFIILGLQAYIYNGMAAETKAKTLAQDDPRTTLGAILLSQHEELTGAGWARSAPAATGPATTSAPAVASTKPRARRIPIDRAMDKVVAEYAAAQGKPQGNQMIAKRRDIFHGNLSVLAALAVMVALWRVAPAAAQYREDLLETGKMRAVENPDIIARPDAQLPLEDAQFTKPDGTKIKLGDLFNHGRPVILSLVYFSCPNLCGLTQDSLANTVREGPESLRLGKDYDIVVVSIDPDDTLADAAAKRSHYLDLMRRQGINESGLTYLTGTEANIQKLADAVGFPYRRNFDDGTLSKSGKYAHSSGVFICTPYGRLSQTILGVQYSPDMVHVALTNAAGGKIGSGFLETVSIPCGAMRFNPKTGQYEANPWFWAGTAVALATLAFMGIFLGLLWRGEFKKAKSTAEGPPSTDGTPAVHM